MLGIVFNSGYNGRIDVEHGQTKRQKWEEKQLHFIREIATESHFHRAFDALGNIHFFAKNLDSETLFSAKGCLPTAAFNK